MILGLRIVNSISNIYVMFGSLDAIGPFLLMRYIIRGHRFGRIRLKILSFAAFNLHP